MRNLIVVAALAWLSGWTPVAWSQETAPDADVFALAEATEDTVLFSEDFEGPEPPELVQWYAGTVPFTLKDRAVTDEDAHSGNRCPHSYLGAGKVVRGNEFLETCIQFVHTADHSLC